MWDGKRGSSLDLFVGWTLGFSILHPAACGFASETRREPTRPT